MTNHGTMADHGTMTASTTLTSTDVPSAGTTSAGTAPDRAPARRLILLVSAAVGLWVLASFAGTMFDPARAQLWTRSLMWSLLASLLISPALLVASPVAEPGARTDAGRESAPLMDAAETAPSEATLSEATPSEATPFVGKGARLWPEPAELREKADLRRKAAAFEQAAFEQAAEQTAFEQAAPERAETDRTPVTA